MPWWSWLLIWIALVVLLVVVLARSFISLYRSGMGVLAEVERAQETADAIAEAVRTESVPYEPRPNALLRPRREVVAERSARVAARDLRRDERRTARLARARALISADPMQFAHLTENRPRKR